jgi:hypothetical protein
VSFVCSRISKQPTAFIFWVTKLIQVDAQVRQVTNVHFIGSFEGIGQSQLQKMQGWMGLVPIDGSWECQEQTFQGLNKWNYVKTAQHLGGEWRHKIHLLHVRVGTVGHQCCSRAVRLFCSRENLAAQIPSNCTTQPTNFLPMQDFSIHLDQFSQHADGAVCSYKTLKPSSQNEHN